jgi:hypothetical protein
MTHTTNKPDRLTQASIETLEAKARKLFDQPFARVFRWVRRDAGDLETWWGVSVGRDSRSMKLVGVRRTLGELPALIGRGALY